MKKSQTLSSLLAHIVKEKGSGETLKLPAKTRWGSYCTALKSLRNTKAALQTLAVHEDATILEETKSNLLDQNFWLMTENCIKLLEPITNRIFRLEGNGILINEVYMAFKDIKSTFAFELPQILLLNEDQRQEIHDAVSRRMNKCIKPIHCAAYMLDPRTQGVELEEDHEIDAMEYIHEIAQTMNLEIAPDLANYRAKQGLWGRSFVWKNVGAMDPVVWWRGICSSKVLSRVAVRLLTAPCTSAATERSFSTHGHVHSVKRNRLTTERAAKISFISYNWNLLHKVKEDYEEEETNTVSSITVSRSPITSPLLDEEQPSTSRGNIEFCDVDKIVNVDGDNENDSDSDSV